MKVRDIPIGYWFELKRNGIKYLMLADGTNGHHSICVRYGSNTTSNISNSSHAKLIPSMGKPRIKGA